MNRTWLPSMAISEAPTTLPVIEGLTPKDGQHSTQQIVTSSVKRSDPGQFGSLDQIGTACISFRNMSEYGDLLVKYLEARKTIFLDQLGWDVSAVDGMEFDQYDTPFCRWIVLHQSGEILGGVRMTPTTAKCGIYSYMIRDAQLGILEGLPSDLLFFEAPVEHNVWEATRFFITDEVPARARPHVQRVLFKSMSQTAMDNGATTVLGIVPELWARWGRRLGARATPIGTKFSIDNTTSQSVLFKTSDYLV